MPGCHSEDGVSVTVWRCHGDVGSPVSSDVLHCTILAIIQSTLSVHPITISILHATSVRKVKAQATHL